MLPKLEYCTDKRILTAFLCGEIDHHSARAVREAIDMAIEKHRPALLVLDFSAVTFMDSSGIGLIMGRFKRMQEHKADILVANPTDSIAKLMRLASVERIVRIVYTAHSANVKE